MSAQRKHRIGYNGRVGPGLYALAIALATTGCAFHPGESRTDRSIDSGDSGSDGGGGDAMIDGCYGTAVARVCVQPPATQLHITGDTTISTSTGSTDCLALLAGSTTDACVIAGTSVMVDSGRTIRATGNRPLLIASSSALRIDGTIDVSSRRGTNVGAGGNPSVCVAATAATYMNSGGGGAGGSFGGVGGDGGSGEGGNGSVASPLVVSITALRGGCRGTAGASTGSAGAGANGGGAVMLIAKTSITIQGVLNASGAGANGATGGDSGGGGGGSGGMIALDAPIVVVLSGAKIFANGGGGGEGFETSNGDFGDDPAAPTPAAPGGTGGTPNGGDGGNGSQTGDGINGKPGNSGGGGGGGGGGGAGMIIVYPTQTFSAGSVMPPAS